MTPSTSSALTPEAATIVAQWAGLVPTPGVTAVLQAFHDRVQRLYAIDVERFEFDFLRPMD